MSKVKPGVKYTYAQMRRLISQEEADALKMQGYVIVHHPTERKVSVEHYTNASAPLRGDGKITTGTGQFKANAPIVKRTPQQRVDSLMLKWIDDCKKAGTVPGLSDDKIREIVGAAWQAGRTEITAEVVREVAQHFLQEAEKKHEEKLSKQVTRHED